MNGIHFLTIPADALSLSPTELAARLRLPQGLLAEETGDALAEITKRAEIKAVYCAEKLTADRGVLDLGFCRTESRALAACLAGCGEVLLFAATLGMGVERYLGGRSALSPSKRYFADAVSSAMIEAVCDEVQARLAAEYGALTPRFSPGYGDLPLAVQPLLLARLDAMRRIGVTLNDALLMIPKKSVTAMIGVKRHED